MNVYFLVSAVENTVVFTFYRWKSEEVLPKLVTYIGINKVLKIQKINYADNNDIDLAIVKSAQIL